jgi:outer membrane protein OmpA-like peptidoglycan-associated protein
MERIAEAQAREKIDQSEAERNQVLLTARAREAEQAKARANQATREAERQRQRANEAAARAEDMAASLAEMKAEQTERGIVLTLSDVLFDTDNAQLKPGANNALDSLAEYLADNEARRLLIEGHTDARGSDDYNQRLSQRRAESVRDELIARGIAPDRLTAVGRGEALPVATNETTSGRQQNRRVEILVSDEDGEFPGTDPQASISH